MSANIDTQAEITITEQAAEEVKRIKKENELGDDYSLRVGVKGGGCSGLTYKLGFDKEPKETDSVIEQNGVKLVIDGKSLFYLMGCILDFSSGLNGKGFEFKNPNAKKTCGCGESFGV